MVTTVSKVTASSSSFLPLVVDYRQKAAAAGRIPTNFLRRELGRSETEILTSRLIDRSVRPLFPPGYCYDTQVMCNILAIDGMNDPDVLAINAASASLAVSDIPWKGPVGAVRVGFIDNEVFINPTRREIQKSSLNLIVTATSQNMVVMLEGSADNILEPNLKKAIKLGVKECQSIIQGIHSLQKGHGKTKRTIEPVNEIDEEIMEYMRSNVTMKLREIFTDAKHDKLSRDTAVGNLRNEVIEGLKSSMSEAVNFNAAAAAEAFSSISKEIFRSLIFENDLRYVGAPIYYRIWYSYSYPFVSALLSDFLYNFRYN